MKELYVYRHKNRKDLYLERNWGCTGWDKPFYMITELLDVALESIRHGEGSGKPFEEDFIVNGKEVTVPFIERKDVEEDGFKGVLVRETKFPISEFEKVPVIVGEPK